MYYLYRTIANEIIKGINLILIWYHSLKILHLNPRIFFTPCIAFLLLLLIFLLYSCFALLSSCHSIMTGDNTLPKQPIDKAYSIASIKACIPSPLDLDKLNYNSWSNLFKRFYKTYDFHKHLEPTASTSTSPPDPFFDTNDSLVFMWIYSTIFPKLFDMVIDDSTSAHEVWKKLGDLFHDNKAARVIQLDNEIRNMAIGSLSVNDFFSRNQVEGRSTC